MISPRLIFSFCKSGKLGYKVILCLVLLFLRCSVLFCVVSYCREASVTASRIHYRWLLCVQTSARMQNTRRRQASRSQKPQKDHEKSSKEKNTTHVKTLSSRRHGDGTNSKFLSTLRSKTQKMNISSQTKLMLLL